MAFLDRLGLRHSGNRAVASTNGWTNQIGASYHVVNGDLMMVTVCVRNLPVIPGTNKPDTDLIVPSPGFRFISSHVYREGADPTVVSLVFIVYAKVADYEDTRREYFWFNLTGENQATFNNDFVGFDSGLWRGETAVNGIAWNRSVGPQTTHVAPTASGVGSQYVVSAYHGGFFDLGWHYNFLWQTNALPTNDAQPQVISYKAGDLNAVSNPWWASYKGGSYRHLAAIQSSTMTATLSTSPRPLQTLLLTPGKVTADLAEHGVDMTWKHIAGFAGEQEGYVIRRVYASTTEYFNTSTGLWQSGQVINPGKQSALHLPKAGWENMYGVSVRLAVAAYASGHLAAFSEHALLTIVPSPTATAYVVGKDPTGIVASLRPSVGFVGTPGNPGLTITAWEAVMVNVSQGVELTTGSGKYTAGLNSSQTWSPDYEVPNNTIVQFMVRVQQDGGEWSNWTTADATTNVSVPGAPAITLTNVRDETSGVPGIQIHADFPWETDAYAWTANYSTMDVERLSPDGWVRIASIVTNPGITEFITTDYGAGSGLQTYRVAARGRAIDGSTLQGDWSQEAITADVEGGWLVDVTKPSTAVRLNLMEESTQERDTRATSFEVVGRAEPLVSYGTVTLRRGGYTVRANNADEEAQVINLLTSGAVLKMSPYQERDPINRKNVLSAPLFFRTIGNITSERWTPNKGIYSLKHVSFEFVEVLPPVFRGE